VDHDELVLVLSSYGEGTEQERKFNAERCLYGLKRLRATQSATDNSVNSSIGYLIELATEVKALRAAVAGATPTEEGKKAKRLKTLEDRVSALERVCEGLGEELDRTGSLIGRLVNANTRGH
jgi:hypothetical protein